MRLTGGLCFHRRLSIALFKADLLPVNMNEEPFLETARKRDAFARPQSVPPIEERSGNVGTVLRGAREFA
jgi:hypothetical protein